MRLVYTFFLLFFANSAFPAEFVVPEQKILGADKDILIGKAADLFVSPVRAKPDHWVGAKYEWKVFEVVSDKIVELSEVKVVPLAEGSNCWFAVGVTPKEYTVSLYVTHLYVVKEGEKVIEVATKSFWITKSLKVVGLNPNPPNPNPNPPVPLPDKDPELPDGRFNLSKFTFKATKEVNDTERLKNAREIAKTYRGIRSSVKAGAIKDIPTFLAETAKLNTERLGDSRAKWKDWSVTLQDEVYRLYSNKTIVTLDDFCDAWEEIAIGLEAIK